VDAIVDSVASKHADVVINVLKYHVWWPSSGDRFYAYNPTENTARVNYYGLNYVPWEAMGGTQFEVYNEESVFRDVESRMWVDSPLEITVETNQVGDTVYVDASVTATGNVDSKASLTFHCVATEWRRPYGGRKHMYIMRDMVPDANGEVFTISQGETVDFQRAWWMDPDEYIPEKMYTVVFVQDDATREILNSAVSKDPPENYMWYMAQGYNDVVPVGETTQFISQAWNLGTVPDTFDVNIAGAPGGWSGTYTTSQGTFSGPSQIYLGPGEFEDISIDIDPMDIPGFAPIVASVTGPIPNYGDVTRERSFNVIHQVDVLVVDDDGWQEYEGYYEAALNPTGLVHGTWERVSEGLTDTDIAESSADAVVWFTSRWNPSFTNADRAALSTYLDGGGRLFAAGSDIGYSLCDFSSPWWGANACNWYQTYLGATYTQDRVNDNTLVGVVGDPIGDGLALDLAGGDGADNNIDPDEIVAIAPAEAVFEFAALPDSVVGVRYDSGTFRTVYFAFPFEAIDNAPDRASVMQRVMDWLFGTTDVVESESLVRPAWLAQNVPNPFNPDTEIRFSVPTRGPVRLSIYNVKGQRVRTLEDGIREPGEYAVHWDGMDHTGHSVASGVYFYALEAGNFVETRKMTLLR
jgi:hypothetical protein